MAGQISVARYLFTRLHQLGVRSVHGVPGDFFLKALDHLKPAGLKWVGNCNELNAAYAADGYARVKGISALFTTFGVGEMSAYNAVAGSFAEHAPVVHIVGTPNRRIQRAKAKVHHGLGDGNMTVFMDMFKHVSAAQADLQEAKDAPSQIDSVLRQALLQKRPVYFGLPSDVVPEAVDAEPLNKPLDAEQSTGKDQVNAETVNLVARKIANAKNPLILVDGLCVPFDIAEEVNELAGLTKIPTMCYPFGKGIVDESTSNFYGVHAGSFGRVDNSTYAKNSDLVLLFGPLLADNNTSGYSTIPSPEVTVTFNHTTIEMPDGPIYNVNTKHLLQQLIDRLKSPFTLQSRTYPNLSSPKDWHASLSSSPPDPTSPITQDRFYHHITRILKPHDHICLANGTPLPGGRDLVLPHPTRILCSSIFLSVGHWLPAAQGAALALRERSSEHGAPRGRVILLEGDGSFQATCQELSTIIRHRLAVTVFLMNNRGYTYERCIHGAHADYNDVADWRYLDAPRFFGAAVDAADPEYSIQTYRVRTWGELDAVLDRREFQEGDGLKMVEVVVDPLDVPEKIKAILRRAGEALEAKD